MIGRRKKEKNEVRNPRLENQRQAAYHYSAKRSNAERIFERTAQNDDSDEKSKIKPKHQIIARLIVLSIALIVVYSLLLVPSVKLHVEDGVLQNDKKVYESMLDDLFSGSLKNHSKLTVDKEAIASEIENKHYEFTDVTVETPAFLIQPQVYVRVTKPALLLSVNSKVFLIDEKGRVVKEANRSDFADLPIVEDRTSPKIDLGKVAVTQDQVRYVGQIRAQSDAKQLSVESMTFVGGGGELDVRYSGLGYFVKYNLFEDARTSFGTFYAVKERVESENPKPAEYVDVRIPERAYVK